MFPAPPAPSFPADHAATYESYPRYEDVTQDGRLIPIAVPPALGGLWRDVLQKHPGTRATAAAGILPILTRLTIVTYDQPIRVDRPVRTHGGFELARDDGPGDPARLYMTIWCETHGVAGRIAPREPSGELAVAGRLFAEHTFTRPFAPPGQRRVTRLGHGFPDLPQARHAAAAATTAGEAPEGAVWVGELTADPAEVVFTLDQTDSNQHVNSLAYIRIFLDAVQRTLARTGRSLAVRSRAIDIAYRKPCFAGDRVRAHVRLFEQAGSLGAAGFVAAPGEEDRPRCYVRAALGR